MKKTIISIIALSLSASLLAGCGGSSEDSAATTVQETSHATVVTEQTTSSPQTTSPETTVSAETVNTDESLFIGDSRTMGLMEYSGLEADFFASVGMSVYNIEDDMISVPNVGKVTFTELLSNKTYGKIYLMIGINELGYDLNQTISVYEELVQSIRRMQPDAKIFIQANLHVTKEKSEEHSYIKNATIDAFNERISQFADGKSIFYLDVNPVFDDENNALSKDLTSDGVHLYAKHYVEWADWITTQSAEQTKEG